MCRRFLFALISSSLGSLLLLSACSANVDSERIEEVSPHTYIEEDEELVTQGKKGLGTMVAGEPASEMISFAIHPQQLLQSEQIWQLENQAFRFKATQTNDQGDIRVRGSYRTAEDWQMEGYGGKDQTFQVINDGESVILEYEQQRRTVEHEEVKYLLPSAHLTVIEELLEQEAYQWVSLTPGELGWYILFRSGVEPLYSAFMDMIQLSADQLSMDEYALEYHLSFNGFDFSSMQLNRIDFRLLKNERSLENVQFTLYRDLGLVDERER